MKIVLVAGARPNFVKIAPLVDAIKQHNKYVGNTIDFKIIHTGQHYDEKLSNYFFRDLCIPKPDINLDVGSASHAVQTAEIMKRFEKVCIKEIPSHVIVVGDVNSTVACALVASKLGIKVVHVEAGLRSFDRRMPEEINRLLTDSMSDLLFTSEESANTNLLQEGVAKNKIHFVGNVMIDTLLKHREKAKESKILDRLGLLQNCGKERKLINGYGLLTLHRSSNVDHEYTFKQIVTGVSEIAVRMPIIFTVHPRTYKSIRKFGLLSYFSWCENDRITFETPRIYCIEPVGYLDFICLMSHARIVLTDSGGIQEETTVLGIPCATLRENTERPVTVTHGTNSVIGTEKNGVIEGINKALHSNNSIKPAPPLWDGRAADRIIRIMDSVC